MASLPIDTVGSFEASLPTTAAVTSDDQQTSFQAHLSRDHDAGQSEQHNRVEEESPSAAVSETEHQDAEQEEQATTADSGEEPAEPTAARTDDEQGVESDDNEEVPVELELQTGLVTDTQVEATPRRSPQVAVEQQDTGHQVEVPASGVQPVSDEEASAQVVLAEDEITKLAAQEVGTGDPEEQSPAKAESPNIANRASQSEQLPTESADSKVDGGSVAEPRPEGVEAVTGEPSALPGRSDQAGERSLGGPQPPGPPDATEQITADRSGGRSDARSGPADPSGEPASPKGDLPPVRFVEQLLPRSEDGAERVEQLDTAQQRRFVERVARAFQVAEARDGTLRLRLHPPELGALKLELRVQNGTLTARLEAETSAARSLLLENLPVLRDRLIEQGVRIEQFDVDLNERGFGGAAENAPHDSGGSADPDRPKHQSVEQGDGNDEGLASSPELGVSAGQEQIDIVI